MEIEFEEKIFKQIFDIKNNLRIGSFNSAYKELSSFLEFLNLNLGNLVCNNSEKLGAINEFLHALMDAIKYKDNILICDILEYGLKPYLKSI